MKKISLSFVAMVALAAASAHADGAAAARSVTLTQDPVVMRLSKDEFRIAFGLNGERCGATGCSGTIHYRVNWTSADGTSRIERKQVAYTVSPLASRTIAVDRQYFDTAEGGHTTDIVKLSIASITCLEGAESRALEVARR